MSPPIAGLPNHPPHFYSWKKVALDESSTTKVPSSFLKLQIISSLLRNYFS